MYLQIESNDSFEEVLLECFPGYPQLLGAWKSVSGLGELFDASPSFYTVKQKVSLYNLRIDRPLLAICVRYNWIRIWQYFMSIAEFPITIKEGMTWQSRIILMR